MRKTENHAIWAPGWETRLVRQNSRFQWRSHGLAEEHYPSSIQKCNQVWKRTSCHRVTGAQVSHLVSFRVPHKLFSKNRTGWCSQKKSDIFGFSTYQSVYVPIFSSRAQSIDDKSRFAPKIMLFQADPYLFVTTIFLVFFVGFPGRRNTWSQERGDFSAIRVVIELKIGI